MCCNLPLQYSVHYLDKAVINYLVAPLVENHILALLDIWPNDILYKINTALTHKLVSPNNPELIYVLMEESGYHNWEIL